MEAQRSGNIAQVARGTKTVVPGITSPDEENRAETENQTGNYR